jgi:hypothetical protein
MRKARKPKAAPESVETAEVPESEEAAAESMIE